MCNLPSLKSLCLLVVCVSFSFSACTLSGFAKKNLDGSKAKAAGSLSSNQVDVSAIDPNTDDALSPVEVEVSRAFISNGKLNVNVHVTVYRSLAAENVVVAVRGLRHGSLQQQRVKTLSEVSAGKMLEPGSKLALNFDLDVAGLSEYQVRCSWGQEALQFLASANQSNASAASAGKKNSNQQLNKDNSRARLAQTRVGSKVKPKKLNAKPQKRVKRVSIETPSIQIPNPSLASDSDPGNTTPSQVRPLLSVANIEKREIECSTPPCDLKYTINARLKNTTSATITAAKLALGVRWVDQGQVLAVPKPGGGLKDNEQLVDLKSLKLAPGKSMKLRVRVNRALPVIPGGSFVPHLRLVSTVSQ